MRCINGLLELFTYGCSALSEIIWSVFLFRQRSLICHPVVVVRTRFLIGFFNDRCLFFHRRSLVFVDRRPVFQVRSLVFVVFLLYVVIVDKRDVINIDRVCVWVSWVRLDWIWLG